jgi:hypothetical protein
MRCWTASPLQPPGTDPGGQAGPRRERLSSFTELPGCRRGAGAGGFLSLVALVRSSSTSPDRSGGPAAGMAAPGNPPAAARSSVRAGVTIQAVK